MKIPNLYAVVFYKIKRLSNPMGDPSTDRSIKLCGKKVSIGCFTYGYENTEILSWGEDIRIKIGRYCSIATGMRLFCGGNHRVDWISAYPFGHVYRKHLPIDPVSGIPASKGDISIGNDVWIGRNVTILSGISIGDGAVIAANSHVVTNIQPYTIVGGNPAKMIKKRFPDEIIKRLLKIGWWNYPVEKIKLIVPFLCDNENQDIYKNLDKIEQILLR